MSDLSIINKIIETRDKALESWDIILPNEFNARVSELIRLWTDNQSETTVLAFWWIPWWSKWGSIKEFAYHLKVRIKQSFEDDDSTSWIKIWDRHVDSETHVLYVSLDGFFRAIWQMRRVDMLKSLDDFLELFYDDEKALAFLEKYLKTYEWFDFEEKVYLKTKQERAANAALSTLRVNTRRKNDKKLIMLDWLNAHTIADNMKMTKWFNDEKALNVIKMMILPRLEMSFARLIKRDSVLSNDDKSIKDVVNFRLKELFFVFSQFTLPSLKQQNLHYVDMTPISDHTLTKEEVTLTIEALKECKDEILEDTGLTQLDWFSDYLNEYVDYLLGYFQSMVKYARYIIPRDELTKRDNLERKKKRRKEEIDEHQKSKGERSDRRWFFVKEKKKRDKK